MKMCLDKLSLGQGFLRILWPVVIPPVTRSMSSSTCYLGTVQKVLLVRKTKKIGQKRSFIFILMVYSCSVAPSTQHFIVRMIEADYDFHIYRSCVHLIMFRDVWFGQFIYTYHPVFVSCGLFGAAVGDS